MLPYIGANENTILLQEPMTFVIKHAQGHYLGNLGRVLFSLKNKQMQKRKKNRDHYSPIWKPWSIKCLL